MNIEEEIVTKLSELKYHIAVAESCTGGLVAAKLINVAGVSEVLDFSMITYANEAKIKFLDVTENDINKYGVVSEQVALAMAKGIAKLANANVGLATSGIAGPSGATKTKPVGMVCFGIYLNGKCYTYTNYFGNIGRQNVRQQATQFILLKLKELLEII